MKKLFSVLLAALMAACFALPAFAAEELDPRLGVGMSVMGFSSVNVQTGETVTSDIIDDCVMTVINEWAEWCGPCQAEMPYFQAAYDYYMSTPEADVQILGSFYSSSPSTAMSTAANFLNSNGYTWPSVVEDTVLAQVFNTSNSIPQTIIVDRHGIVRAHDVGSFTSKAALMQYISDWYETLLAEEGPQTPGDVDGDGQVTMADVTVLSMYLNGENPEVASAGMANADANGDGGVDIRDIAAIYAAIAVS